MRPSESLSVIIPVYNEAEVIETVVRGFYDKVISKHPNAELIVCEDGSTDGTTEILRDLQKELNFKFYHSDERKGYLRALREALVLGTKEWIFFSDSDNTHDPADTWKLIKKVEEENLDFCTGEKRKRNDPFYRKFFSWGFSFVIWLFFGVKQHSINAGFKIMRKEIAQTIVPQVKYLKYGFSAELTIRVAKNNYKFGGVPVAHFERKTGQATQINLRTMPKVVKEQFKGILKLRKELKQLKKEQQKK